MTENRKISALDERDRFRQAGREVGLSTEVIEWWLKLSRPQLEAAEGDEWPIVGQLGGKPSLPEGDEWPRSMEHIATVDLALVPRSSHDLDLPEDGRLVFFAETFDVPREAKVIYVAAGTPVTEREPYGDSTVDKVAPARPFYGRPVWTIPSRVAETSATGIDTTGSDRSPAVRIDFQNEDEIDESVLDAIMRMPSHTYASPFWIGGHPSGLGSGGEPVSDHQMRTVLAAAYLETSSELRTDSDWDSPFLLNFVIAYEDLAARRFDKVWLFFDFQ